MTPPSSLLRLPAELRLKIYSHLLTSPVLITNPHYQRISASTPSPSITHVRAWPPQLFLSTAILLACRLLYSEAIETLYSTNTFVLTRATYAQQFAQFAGAGLVRQYVREVLLEIDVADERTHAWSRYLAGSVHGEKFCGDYAGMRGLEVRFCTIRGSFRQERYWLWDLVRGLVRSVSGVETVVVRPLMGRHGSLFGCLAEVMQACMMDGREDREVIMEMVRRAWEGKLEGVGALRLHSI